MRNKVILLLMVIGLGIYRISGQAAVGSLTIKVKAAKEYQGLWDSILLVGKDTTFRLGRNSENSLALIPQGHYHVILKSRINGMLHKEINLKKTAAIEFNALNYYKPYTDTSCIFYNMKDGDTCFMNYTGGSNKLPAIEYFMVAKDGEKYLTLTKNELNQWRSIPIFDYEFQEFIAYGKYQGAVNTSDTGGLGVYYCSLKGQLLRRNCGICLYGFLLRKRLVKGQ